MSREILPITRQQEQYVGYVVKSFVMERNIQDNEHIRVKGDVDFYSRVANGIRQCVYNELVHPITEIEVVDDDFQGVHMVFERITNKDMKKVFKDIVRAEEKRT